MIIQTVRTGSGLGKTNSLFDLLSHTPDIDKIYLYAKDPYEAIYQLLINKTESAGLEHFKDSRAFIEYWNDMDDIYKILKNSIQTRKVKY